jgi:hypothetical protein
MQGPGRRDRSGSGGGREARLAAKLRQNLVRRKAKARAADDAAAPHAEVEAAADDNDKGT